MKTCAQCHEAQPADTEHFDRDTRRESGLRSQCKLCRALRVRNRHPAMQYTNTRTTLPAAPLIPLVQHALLTCERKELAALAGVSDKLVQRVLYDGGRVSLDAADRLCIAMGTMLSLVYEDDEKSTTNDGYLRDEREAA